MFITAIVFTVGLSSILCHPTQWTSSLEQIDQYNQHLSEELKSHLEGDVYREDDDVTNNNSQEAPLKKWERKRWPDGIVPYVLTSDYNQQEKNLIRSGLRDIEAAAPCIKFVEYSEGDYRLPATHILVVKNTGCWSLIGRTSTGKNQKLALDYYCIDETKGTIVHEFLHALGFYHEQARPDRDNYITIYWDRISEGGEAQFKKTERSDDLGVSYDRVSVMHYPNKAYAKSYDIGNTIEWRADPSLPLGGNKLSSKDILQLNRLYCEDGWVSTKKPATTTTKITSTWTTKPTTTTTKQTTTTTIMTKPTTTSTTTQTTPTTEIKTTTTSDPTIESCGDYQGNCISISRYRCSSYTKQICPRSCKVCTGGREEMCLNLSNVWDDEYCEKLGNQDRCQHSVMRTRYTMKINCSRTCCDRNELYSYRG